MANSKKTTTVTAQDVALKAGVSRAAVSRTFTNNGSIAPKTREKVLKAAKELGYQVNFLAQGLNRKRSQLIGVVVARLSDPFRSHLLEGLLEEIQNKGYQALVMEVRNPQALEDIIRRFTQYRVSGVIVTSGQPPVELIQECVHHDIPVVGINRYMDIPNVDFVCSDNEQGALLALEQLMLHGCRHLLWLNYHKSTWGGIERGEAFRRKIQTIASDLRPHLSELTAPHDGYEGGRKAAQKWYEQGGAVDGVFCANDQLACGFLDAMRELGLEPPRDFKIIGFDDTPQASYYSYQLSSVAQNIGETAKRALHCLATRGANPSIEQRIDRVPVELVSRQTAPFKAN
ncbi:LacI family DNA-binding transcriptional regulator [Marinomonas epiphytica]